MIYMISYLGGELTDYSLLRFLQLFSLWSHDYLAHSSLLIQATHWLFK
jgi:hypothetical protein